MKTVALCWTLASLAALASLSIVPSFGQTKKLGEIVVPENFITHDDLAGSTFSSTVWDTLSYHRLQTVREDFIVNRGCGEYATDQSTPIITYADDGSSLWLWTDNRTGAAKILGQLYLPNGERFGGALNISQDSSPWNLRPDCAFNPVTGEYLIVWAEPYDVKLLRLSRLGKLIGQPRNLNAYWRSNTNYPSIAIGNDGSFIVTWYGDLYCCLNVQAYFRVFDQSANPLTDDMPLMRQPAISVSSIGGIRRIAADDRGNFVITWSSFVGGGHHIFIQPVNQNGFLTTAPVIVSDSTISRYNVFPSITSTPDGYFLIAWHSSTISPATNMIAARVYQRDSGFVTSTPLPFVQTTTSTSFLCTSGNDRFYLVWIDTASRGTRIGKHGQVIGSPVLMPLSPQLRYWYSASLVYLVGA
ncbi:MAG: hypothetical protein C4326_15410 [Ignavibacteria bacterium]